MMLNNIKSSFSNLLYIEDIAKEDEKPYEIIYDVTNEDFEFIDDHMDKKFNEDNDESLK